MLVESRPATNRLRRRAASDAVSICGAPLAAGAVYAVAFVVTLPALLVAVYASADTAITPYLTQGWLRAPSGSAMLMGHAPFYLGYWLLRLLRPLGDHRATWELAPWVLAALASAAVGWGAARAAGRAAGLSVSVALVCTGSSLLDLQFAWSVHGLAYVNVTLLGAFAVWLVSDPAPRHPLGVGLAACALTLMTASGIATDRIVLIAGLIPFALCGALAARRSERGARARTATVVLALVGGSLVGAPLINAAMRADGIRATPFAVGMAPLSEVPAHLRLLIQGVFSLLNGAIQQPGGAPTDALGYVCEVAVVLVLALAAVEAARCLRPLIALSGGSDHARARLALDARTAQALYWVLSAAGLTAAYLFTTVAIDIFTQRYLVTIAYAVVILGITGGVTLARRWQLATAAAVTILVIAGTAALVRGDLRRREPTAPTVAMADAVSNLAHRERAAVVYAGYWDAYPLGWLARDAVPVYPVTLCGGTLCPWMAHGTAGSGISTWYRVRSGQRSMLILDRELDPSVGLPRRPLRSFGTPVARFSLDHGRLTAYLYDHDLARRFVR